MRRTESPVDTLPAATAAPLPRRFPWRPDNRFTLLVDGERFYPRMLAAIAGARHYVLLEMYLFESGLIADRFIDALREAAGRGVQVFVLLDSFGAARLHHTDRERLRQAGIQVCYYNPLRLRRLHHNLPRDHRKLLLVDAECAFVGGAGITDAFAPDAPHTRRAWRETLIETRGPVLEDWHALFAGVWRQYAHTPLPPALAPDPSAGTQAGRVNYSAGPGRQELKRILLNWIRGAEHRVWIATAYFIPSLKLRRALSRAARRGVDVRLLLPGPHTDHPGVRHAGRRFYNNLLRHGVHIYEYQPRFLHQKVVVCDARVSIGSSNLDRWNLRWNLEAGQDIDAPDFTAEVIAMLEHDFQLCTRIQLERWHRRPWYRRMLEWLFGHIDRWLNRLGEQRRNR